MVGRFGVVDCMVVSTSSIPVLSAATKMATSHAKPETAWDIALLTVSHRLLSNPWRSSLIEKETMLAGLKLQLPFWESTLEISRLSFQDWLNQATDFIALVVKSESTASKALESGYGIILLWGSVYSSWLADCKLCNLSRFVWLCALLYYFMNNLN